MRAPRTLIRVSSILVLSGTIAGAVGAPSGASASSGLVARAPTSTTTVKLASTAGVTLTQSSLIPWGGLIPNKSRPPLQVTGHPNYVNVATFTRLTGITSAISADIHVISQAARFVNVSIMGWGSNNPEPSPGVYDWSSLDIRMAQIQASGATPIITLCAAPDWMKGGQAGQTNYNALAIAPLPQYYAAFAQLAVAIAKRYPFVQYYQVWNELKGFWNPSANTWDIQSYTTMYNDVYSSLKDFNPHLHIGGPYVPIVTWKTPTAGGNPSSITGPFGTVDQRSLNAITYWLKNSAGADFISLDAGTTTHDGFVPKNPFAANELFAALDRWLVTQTKLPIFWSEWYSGEPPGASPQEWNAISAVGLMDIAASGAAVSLMWDPEFTAGGSTPGAWNAADGSTNGSITPLGRAFEELNNRLTGKASALAYGGAAYAYVKGSHFLAINATATRIALKTPDGVVSLSPWGISSR